MKVVLYGSVSVVVATLLSAALGSDSMLQYYLGPIPVGAVTLGMIATSGFGIASYFYTGLRFTIPMLAVLGVSMAAYWVALEIMDFVLYGDSMGYIEFFFMRAHPVIRAFELFGFLVGGFLVIGIVPLFSKSATTEIEPPSHF